ncbi:ATP synthase subunit I [Roseovarius sp. TE539]|uniref:N-ATPase subunit AtpR n=1 Tax=Roseovarius sp. TE539 TaxID=2249812 RepID=UPI0015EFD55A|nr:ATP synthase subunit I [Roseovarius sp. TE539]
MMETLLQLGGAGMAGAALGALYLGLLWRSVQALTGQRRAATFMALALARAVLVLGAVAGALGLGAGAGTLLAALAGFVVIRIAATRRTDAIDGRPTWK